MTSGTPCVYNYDLMQLFTPNACIVKDLFSACGKWDMQFALTQPQTGYAPALTAEPAGTANKAGYTLLKNTEKAAELTFVAEGDNWYAPSVTSASAVNLSLQKNDAGKGLVGNKATLKVWADINGYN